MFNSYLPSPSLASEDSRQGMLDSSIHSMLSPQPRHRATLLATKGEMIAFCVFIFTLSFRPNEPHLTALLRSKGLTTQEINNQVFPVWTYSYFLFLCVFGLLSEPLKYAPVIWTGVLCRIVTRCLLINGSTVVHMQIMQVFYAFGCVGELVFYAYIYHRVAKGQYSKITAFVQASFIIAQTVGVWYLFFPFVCVRCDLHLCR